VTELYLIDRLSRLDAILVSPALRAQTPNPAETTLGVGFFSCRRAEQATSDTPPGLSFLCDPAFLRECLLAEVLCGHLSPVDQRPLLLGANTSGSSPGQVLGRWLMTGLHPLQDLSNEGVALTQRNHEALSYKALGRGATQVGGAGLLELLQPLLHDILTRSQEAGAQTLVLPASSQLLVDFLLDAGGASLFGLDPVDSGPQDFALLTPSDQDLCHMLTAEAVIESCLRLMPAELKNLVVFSDSAQRLEASVTVARSVKARDFSQVQLHL
jgi:hypothetical protein